MRIVFTKLISGGSITKIGKPLDDISQYDQINNFSNPKKVKENAKKYLGEDKANFIFRSTNPNKKYMIFNPLTKRWVFFGQMEYEDFTKHQDEDKRKRYLARATNIRGNWKQDKYSANNLSINLLWNI